MGSFKVLVIDDNDLNRKLCTVILVREKYEVITAGSAEEGLRSAEEIRPDLILMDIQLPGMDGLTATRAIKQDERLKHIPVVALTSFAMVGDRDRIIAAGCNGYLTKPIDIQRFVETVRQMIHGEEAAINRSPDIS
jgi:CheY-like chemotaxis protein